MNIDQRLRFIKRLKFISSYNHIYILYTFCFGIIFGLCVAKAYVTFMYPYQASLSYTTPTTSQNLNGRLTATITAYIDCEVTQKHLLRVEKLMYAFLILWVGLISFNEFWFKWTLAIGIQAFR